MNPKLKENFKPSPKVKNYYRIVSSLILIVPIIVTIATLLGAETGTALTASGIVWVIFLLIYGFNLYWISKFYDSISFRLADSEIVVEKGVWIKNVQNVPYKKIMNITTKQGPIYRHFDLGKVEIETAGSSGRDSGPEASIFGVENFVEVKDSVLELVRKRKETGEVKPELHERGETSEIIKELREIRKILEKTSGS